MGWLAFTTPLVIIFFWLHHQNSWSEQSAFRGLQGLLAIEAYRVGRRGEDGHGGHGHDGDYAAYIEKTMRPSGNSRGREKKQRGVGDDQENADFGWTKLCKRQTEDSESVGREIGFDGKQQKCDQQAHGYAPIDITRGGEAAHKKECAEGVDHVVDVESVAWALAISYAGQGAVEAVAKPI